MRKTIILLASLILSMGAAAQSKKEEPQFLSDSIADMLLKYYGATTVEERAQYVMEPERVMPLMRDYYSGGIRPLNKFYHVDGE